jgi:L-rhamnose-H+ transport protein
MMGMTSGPLLGIPLHWLGGLASGSFYVPFRGVRRWSWEIYWLLAGIFSWLLCPWIFATLLTKSLPAVIAAQPVGTLLWTYLFGLLWGFGGLTYGLTMRYLGLSLGTGVALGCCAVFGTLMPPIAKLVDRGIPVPESILEIAASAAGRITLIGVALCVLGIGVVALGGVRKNRELPVDRKRQAIAEFHLVKGLCVAVFCGVMSACFAFALTAANPIAATSLGAGTDPLWSGLPKLVVLLWGGFTTNLIWCAILIRRNRSGAQYFRVPGGGALLPNYLLSAIAGITWYLQFFFYTMGETRMGRYGFASWSVHMASIIVFATLWGWIFREWQGSSRKVYVFVAAGMSLLLVSTLVIGAGAYFKAQGGGP